ncbi:MAG: hypothetical protein GY873_06815 [Bosea sp.]|uniref:Uncharacterized protein n=4 Tax=Bosea TaxID=85413 RepID=A0A927I1F0_9HYPH|nr:hypothetical protein [Bosea spartocytisi]MBD3847302.1 hypothetical protein [Bosea spartocytisi]MCP4559292.1 hypothetical protein [Bosea sp. (in: a-proteobacteria)]MCP4733893.1 hypothetical protein [Bosea sp. (in: a-proteobacteria)]MCT4475412.1 hypothetical protein [Bosea spartocytisi]
MPATRKKGSAASRRSERSGKYLTVGLATSLEPLFTETSIPRTKRVLSAYAKAIKRFEDTGKPVRMTVTLKSTGMAPEVQVEDAAPATGDALDRALASAAARGAQRVAEILKDPQMLSADQFAEEIGATRETVNRKRKRHEVLGLEGPKRGLRFPRWQLDDSGRLLADLPKLFQAVGDHPWAVYRFLVQAHRELDGSTGLAAVRAGRVDEAVEVAKATGRGDFS